MSNPLNKVISAVKSVKPIFWFLIVLIAALVVISLYNRDVIQGFVGSSDTSFTMYYVDWCPHCKTAKPIFTDFMGSGTVTVNGKPVKCTMVNAETNPEVVKELNVKGYPSFLLSKGSQIVEFNGPRTVEGFMDFLKQNI
jgi:thiol-disulfide isomerase/thioredoxin